MVREPTTEKRAVFSKEGFVDTAACVKVNSGPRLVTKFQFRNPSLGKPIGVWRVWCSGFLFIVGSVLDLTAAFRGAPVDIACGVDSVLCLFALLPGWRTIAVGLPTAVGLTARVGLPACVGPPVNADLFVGTLAW
jgi:hypothetical protein